MIEDYLVWKSLSVTKRIIEEIEAEHQDKAKELSTGSLLLSPTSEKLAREYSYTIGYIDGIQFLKDLLIKKEEENVNDDSNYRDESN